MSKTTSIFAATILVAALFTGLLSRALAAPESPNLGLGTPPGILALITDDDVFATVDLNTLVAVVDPSQRATQHYGPYTSDSPDSGTCGNDWAQDKFDRHFTVFKNPDGTLTVVQQFKAGSFVTDAGPSPGACENTVVPQGTVDDAVTGTMHGYFIIPLPPGTMQTSHDASCVAGSPSTPCTTTGFINTHFDCTYLVTCSVTTFAFHYSAGDQKLIMHQWKNASPDRGGNSGDIRSSTI